MADKLIDWLLKEDILQLREGLAPREKAEIVEAEIFEDIEPVESAPTPGSIAAAAKTTRKRSPLTMALAAVIALAVLAGVGLMFAPPGALGPLAPLAGQLQGMPADLPAAATVPQAASMPASSATMATTAATEVAMPGLTAPTTDATPTTLPTAGSLVSEPTPLSVEVAAAAPAAATQPAVVEAAAAVAATIASNNASGQIVAPPTTRWMVVTGPLRSSKLPPNVTALGFPTEITYASVRQTGREVVSMQPVADDVAENAKTALEAKGYKVTANKNEAGTLFKVGPFLDRAAADDAAIVLVMNQVVAKAQDLQVVVKTPYLNAGPFDDEFAAERARADLAGALGTQTWRRDVSGTQP